MAPIGPVAIIGAGTIGASWAALCLAHGQTVRVFDPRPDCEGFVKDFIARAWPALTRLGLGEDADPDRVSFFAEPAAAVAGAGFVQESGPEDLAAKRALYGTFENGLEPDAVLASSTSGFMPSDLQAGRIGPERYVVGHPFNPPHLMPLVEVVGGRETEPAAVDRAMAFYAALGKHPIRIAREMPGHVANRMQAALFREAIHLVLEGVATTADVDAAIAYGPGIRWAMMGPHALHALAGGEGGLRHLLEHIGPAMAGWWADLGKPEFTPEVIDRLVASFEQTEPRPIAALAAERDVLVLELLDALQRGRALLAADDEDVVITPPPGGSA
jgi:3-hydroxyacyl-CoA dehydrogenase